MTCTPWVKPRWPDRGTRPGHDIVSRHGCFHAWQLEPPVCPGQTHTSRWSRQSGSGVLGSRRHPAVHPSGAWRPSRRRRWPLVYRLRHVVGPAASRARPGRADPRALRRGRTRHQLRRSDRPRGGPGPGRPAPDAVDRACTLRELRDGSHDERVTPRARRHRARADDQVRGVLSRPWRRVPGAGRLRRHHVGRADQPWCVTCRRRRHPGGSV